MTSSVSFADLTKLNVVMSSKLWNMSNKTNELVILAALQKLSGHVAQNAGDIEVCHDQQLTTLRLHDTTEIRSVDSELLFEHFT